MTWSLELRNGDLTLSGSGFGTVTEERKLVQDLRCALLERMGNDQAHPEFGSLIDGGVRPDGVEVFGVIGEELQFAAIEVESEIRRVTNAYRTQQLIRAKDDKFTYGKVTLTQGEALLAVSDIQMQQIEDMLHVMIVLTNARGTDYLIQLPLLNVPLI